MDQARTPDPGSSLDLSGQDHQHQHHHNVFDDVLNTEQVEADDAAIIRAEAAQNQADFDSQGFPTTGGLSKTDTLSGTLDEGFGGKIRLHAKLLRAREHAKVTNVELFFDLVFVYASKS